MVALESQALSAECAVTSVAAKYLGALPAGLPSGFSISVETKVLMSCGWNPRTQAVCSTFRRAGRRTVLRRSFASILLMKGKNRFPCDSCNSVFGLISEGYRSLLIGMREGGEEHEPVNTRINPPNIVLIEITLALLLRGHECHLRRSNGLFCRRCEALPAR